LRKDRSEVVTMKMLNAAGYANGAWTAPALLSSPSANVRTARLKYDGQGNAAILWSEAAANPAACAINVAAGNAKSGFGSGQLLSTDCCTNLQLAVNRSGAALAAWSGGQLNGGGNPVIGASRSAAGIWSVPFVIGDRTYRSGQPSVALADNGLAIAVWLDAYGVNWSRRAVDGTWTTPGSLDRTGSTIFAGAPTVAMDGAGNAVVVAPAFDATFTYTPLLAAKLKVRSNTWSLLTTIGDGTAATGAYQLDATPAGSYIVGWVDTNADPNTGTPIGAKVSTLNAFGGWSTKTFGSGDYDVAAAAGSGFGVVVWNDTFGQPSALRASIAALR
jgi:hypothetical protein